MPRVFAFCCSQGRRVDYHEHDCTVTAVTKGRGDNATTLTLRSQEGHVFAVVESSVDAFNVVPELAELSCRQLRAVRRAALLDASTLAETPPPVPQQQQQQRVAALVALYALAAHAAALEACSTLRGKTRWRGLAVLVFVAAFFAKLMISKRGAKATRRTVRGANRRSSDQ